MTANIINILQKPPWRTVAIIMLASAALLIWYTLWTPGENVLDGTHDMGTNGIWIQHGWLGDDKWFDRYHKDPDLFRNEENIKTLAASFSKYNIHDVYPHLCPSSPNGNIPAVDTEQTELFLNHFDEFRVMPWIGGRLNVHCFPESKKWRETFISSITRILNAHPRFAGVHINIEPLPSGNKDFLILLRELKKALPDNKILSIAAYPPPTILHPTLKVHWEEDYFMQVSSTVDQMVVMMYDTAVRFQKVYQHLMASWTEDILIWGCRSEILLGIPVYDDPGVQYHTPQIENIQNSLLGIHAGLNRFSTLPLCYQGVSIYSEWEMDADEWLYFKNNFTGD